MQMVKLMLILMRMTNNNFNANKDDGNSLIIITRIYYDEPKVTV